MTAANATWNCAQRPRPTFTNPTEPCGGLSGRGGLVRMPRYPSRSQHCFDDARSGGCVPSGAGATRKPMRRESGQTRNFKAMPVRPRLPRIRAPGASHGDQASAPIEPDAAFPGHPPARTPADQGRTHRNTLMGVSPARGDRIEGPRLVLKVVLDELQTPTSHTRPPQTNRARAIEAYGNPAVCRKTGHAPDVLSQLCRDWGNTPLQSPATRSRQLRRQSEAHQAFIIARLPRAALAGHRATPIYFRGSTR